MEITIERIKEFAWQQMDAMWHDNYGTDTLRMVKFTYKGYVVVNPWMDEKTQKSVDPYEYYGKRRTERFIEEACRKITLREKRISLESVNHFNYMTRNGRIFCKRKDKVRKVAPEYKDCNNCPYLFGSLQGMGVECMWEDVPPLSPVGLEVRNPQEEFMRVTQLIDMKILKKG